MEAYRFIRRYYPHMGPQEVELWTRFLSQTDMRFIRIDYDVRVGPGYVPREYSEKYKTIQELLKKGLIKPEQAEVLKAVLEDATALTKLRIDAVGETEKEIWIFEVKPRAGRSALGQLEAYYYWYVREYKPKKPVKLAVVCYEVDPNMKPIFEERGIKIFTVKREK